MTRKSIQALTILLTLALTAPCLAGWKSDIAMNQAKAENYIMQLQSGDTHAKRPKLKKGNGWKSKNAYSEIVQAIKRAESQAKQGRYNSIQLPRFTQY